MIGEWFLVDVLDAADRFLTDKLAHGLYSDRAWVGRSDPLRHYFSLQTDDGEQPVIMAQAKVEPHGNNVLLSWSLMVGKDSIDDSDIVRPRPTYGQLRKEVGKLMGFSAARMESLAKVEEDRNA